MLKTLKLLLPALVPSWRFFDIIAPSPRIQFALLNEENGEPLNWQEFRPRPNHVPFVQMLARLFWNPHWNESLFMVSCAERLMQNPTQHSEDEILQRILNELKQGGSVAASHVQFRLLYIYREGDELHQVVTYHSRIEPVVKEDAS